MGDQRTLDRIEHMLAAIAGIERLTSGKSLGDYADDVDGAAAVERHFERLSEASRHLPEDIKQDHPGIPWRAVADLGNVLRHAYDQELVRRKVESGLYNNASEVVREALRLMADQDQIYHLKLARLRGAIEAGEASGPAREFDFETFMKELDEEENEDSRA